MCDNTLPCDNTGAICMYQKPLKEFLDLEDKILGVKWKHHKDRRKKVMLLGSYMLSKVLCIPQPLSQRV